MSHAPAGLGLPSLSVVKTLVSVVGLVPCPIVVVEAEVSCQSEVAFTNATPVVEIRLFEETAVEIWMEPES